jgi:hypothetical protein
VRCTSLPAGWYCSREPGHDGPCAAWWIHKNGGGEDYILFPVSMHQELMEEIRELRRKENGITIECELCHTKAELPRVGKEGEFISIIPATGWEIYPRRRCPNCK